MRDFNLHGNKNYNKEQLSKKYQILKIRHQVFSQLLGHTRIGWDLVSKMVVGCEAAWASAIAVSAKHNMNIINYQNHLYWFLYK